MELIEINGESYQMPGKVRGHSTDKFNRATKLAYQFDVLDCKFRGMVERGIKNDTYIARSALAVLMLMHTGIRIGNESSAEGYMTNPHPNQKDKVPEFVQTYGLTTLQKQHFVPEGKGMRLFFVGKKQVENSFLIKDKQMCKWLYACCDESATEGTVFGISVYELTKFIKKYVGKIYSPKDFRCMKANIEASKIFTEETLLEHSLKKDKRVGVKRMYLTVSELLNNTPGVCRKSYVSPEFETLLLF